MLEGVYAITTKVTITVGIIGEKGNPYCQHRCAGTTIVWTIVERAKTTPQTD